MVLKGRWRAGLRLRRLDVLLRLGRGESEDGKVMRTEQKFVFVWGGDVFG